MVRKVAASQVEISREPRAVVSRHAFVQHAQASACADGSSDPVETEVYKEAYLEGFDAGHADGDKQARADLSEALEEARKAGEASEQERQAWLTRLQDLADTYATAHDALIYDAQALAVEIAYAAICRVLGEAHVDQEWSASVVANIMQTHGLREASVRVCPSDLKKIRNTPDGVQWIQDASLEPGDCVVSTLRGDIDGGLEQQLTAIQRRLLSSVRGGDR